MNAYLFLQEAETGGQKLINVTDMLSHGDWNRTQGT